MQESPILYSEAALKKIKDERERVDSLRESDNPYQDSVHDIAAAEDKIREEMKRQNVPSESIGYLANMFSDVELEKAEANKEKWQDKLTGLRNKRALLGEVPGLLGLEKRNEKEAAILMIDFDHFKKVNDELGHDAGDQALKVIADIIRNSVRNTDFVYRYGGEEFVVFLMGTNIASAQETAEKIRENIEKAGIGVLDKDGRQHTLKKTASVGCIGTEQLISWDDKKKDEFEDIMSELITKADTALYNAKENGRNRVMLYSENMKQNV